MAPLTEVTRAFAVPPAGSPPGPKRRRVGVWLALVVVLGGLGAGGWYLSQPVPVSANAGDCVTQTGENTLRVVACGDASAEFTVAGTPQPTAFNARVSACAAFPAATTSYWEGKDGEPGLVLCLEPVKR